MSMMSNDRRNAQENQFPNPNILEKISPDTKKEPKTKETPQLLKEIDLTTKISQNFTMKIIYIGFRRQNATDGI